MLISYTVLYSVLYNCQNAGTKGNTEGFNNNLNIYK